MKEPDLCPLVARSTSACTKCKQATRSAPSRRWNVGVLSLMQALDEIKAVETH